MAREPLYGQYLGFVVNNEDPEKRNRVQVFVPHLSNTLYSGWNQDQTNISFKDPLSLPTSLQDRLRSVLPWAEAAMPIFGGSTANNSNPKTQKNSENSGVFSTLYKAAKDLFTTTEPSTINSPTGLGPKFGTPNTANSTADSTIVSPPSTGSSAPVNSLGEIPENVLKYLYSIGASEGGFPTTGSVTTSDLEYIQKQSYGSALLNGVTPGTVQYNKWVAKAYNDPSSPTYQNLAASQQKYGDYGPFQYNSQDAARASRYGASLNQYDSVSTQMVELAKFFKGVDPVGYQKIANGDFSGQYKGPFGGLFVAGPSTRSTREAAISSLSKSDIIANVGAIDSKSTIQNAYANYAKNENSSTSKIIDQSKDEAGATAARVSNASSGGVGSHNGIYSSPNFGAKVWVFFYGGDVQKPVYFAAAVEPAATA